MPPERAPSQLPPGGRYTCGKPWRLPMWADHNHPKQVTQVAFTCAESHRRLDAVLLHIKARARELAVVLLQSNHEYRGAGHQEAAVARGVSEDRGGRVNRVFGFSALITDFDDIALRRLGNRADRGIGHH